VKYNFIGTINSKHLEIFANSVKNGYLEITKEDWELLKDDRVGKE